MKRRITYLSMPGLVVFVAGCVVFPPAVHDPDPRDIPPAFVLFDPVQQYPPEWWHVFESRHLNALMDMAFEGNMSIQQATARLDQAKAATLRAGASLIPGVDVSGSSGMSRQEIAGDALRTGTSEQFSAGISVPSYELDIWGRVRSGHEAARRDFLMSEEDLRAVYITVSAEIVTRWLEYMYYQAVYDVIKAQLEANLQVLDLIETRFRLGLSTALDVYQQRQIVAAVESLQPETSGRLAELLNEMAILVGKPAGTDLGIAVEPLPEILPIPDPGIPADILAVRPDVRRAGLALEAAEWRVAAARADRLPALRLSGGVTYSSDEIGTLFDNWMANLTAALVGPVFDAGRRRYEVDRARAMAEERLSAYRHTVLNAVVEVQNTMIQWSYRQKTRVAQELQLAVARDAYRESMTRYRAGTVEYLPVLTTLTQVQQLERSLLQSQYRLLLTHVSLLRALGGGLSERPYESETNRSLNRPGNGTDPINTR